MGVYRLPDGTVTSDAAVYGNAWCDLGEKVERFFPGYVVDAFDPDVRFSAIDFSHTFSLPLPAVRALLTVVGKEDR